MRMAVAALGWVVSIELADVQLVVAILSGLVVIVFTALNTYVLWRDRIRGQRKSPGDGTPQ